MCCTWVVVHVLVDIIEHFGEVHHNKMTFTIACAGHLMQCNRIDRHHKCLSWNSPQHETNQQTQRTSGLLYYLFSFKMLISVTLKLVAREAFC